MSSAEDMLRLTRTPLALAELPRFTLRLVNPRFQSLFGGGQGRALGELVGGFDAGKAAVALQDGGSFELETEALDEGMKLPLALVVRPCGAALALIEGRDLTLQKEAEHMLDSYARMAERQARDLRREKERAEKLLLNVMPRAIYEEIRDLGSVSPQRFDDAAVLMLDFVGFSERAIDQDAKSVVAELNEIFTAFDRIVELFDCERIKTSGDGYMAVSGIPDRRPDHVANLARVALRMRRYLTRRNGSDSSPWLFRAGIATGPLIGSIVGIQKYVYDVFGPTANLAARLEGQAQAMQIAVCQRTKTLLADEFALASAGEVELKGFGCRSVWLLEEERPAGGLGK